MCGRNGRWSRISARKNSGIAKTNALSVMGSLRVFERFRSDANDRLEFRFTARNHTDRALEPIRRKYGQFEYVFEPGRVTPAGADVFRLREYANIRYPLACSRRFVEFVRERGWDNFTFDPLDSVGRDSFRVVAYDLLAPSISGKNLPPVPRVWTRSPARQTTCTSARAEAVAASFSPK